MKTKSLILAQLIISFIIVFGYYLYVNKDGDTHKKGVIVEELENRENGKSLPSHFFDLLDEYDLNLNKSKLVFRFSEINCGTCVSREVRLVKELARDVGWDRIIFLTSNSNQEYLNRFKRVSQVKTKIFNIDQEYFPIDKEWISTPYMFIVDNDSIYKNMFISMKENEKRSEHYLGRIEEQMKLIN